MELIGMLDSPYVRRVAVSLQLLDLPFVHRPVSVLRTYAAFEAINPVVKAPTLVCDDGTVLMDSTLIIDFAQTLAGPARALMPAEATQRQRGLRTLGLALAACEKSVQVVYERKLRPPDKQYAPWLERVTRQMAAAFSELEADRRAGGGQPPLHSATIDQATLTTAVCWHFARQLLPDLIDSADHPTLQRLSDEAEALPEFTAAKHGDGTVPTGAA